MKIQQAKPLPTVPKSPILRFSKTTWSLANQGPIYPILGDLGTIPSYLLSLERFSGASAEWVPLLSQTQPPSSAIIRTTQLADALRTSTTLPAGVSNVSSNARSPEQAKEYGAQIAQGALGILQLSSRTTHDELSGALTQVGVAPVSADKWADKILGGVNSHGFHSVVIGAGVGGLVVLGIGKIRPSTPPQTKYAIGGVATVLVASWLWFSAPHSSPLIGKWTLNTTESRYSGNNPPRGETIVFAPDASGLAVSDSTVMPDGKLRQLEYHLDLDGHDHALPGSLASITNGADIIHTVTADNEVTTTFLKNGEAVGSEDRLVSSDRKELTITSSRAKRGGGKVEDVLSYDRK